MVIEGSRNVLRYLALIVIPYQLYNLSILLVLLLYRFGLSRGPLALSGLYRLAYSVRSGVVLRAALSVRALCDIVDKY